MRKFLTGFLILFLFIIFQTEDSISQNPVVIDFTTKIQKIDGFGASTAWHGRISDKEADISFGNDENQLGLSILRVRIDPGGENRWRDELENSKKAIARGAIVLASPWTPPSTMKTINNPVGGSLNPSEYGNYVSFLNDFIDYSSTNGVAVSAISLQNEPNIDVKYESCNWSPTQLLNFCRDYSKDIRADVVVPEAYNFDFAYSDPILNDAVAVSNIAIIGGHLYGTTPRKYENAITKGKRVWMTEHYYDPDDINTCMIMGKEILDCMNFEMNAYIWWYLRQPGCNLITSQGNIMKKGYIMAQFSKFIRPGYFKVKATWYPQSGVYTCAFVGDKKVIVVINRGTTSKTQQFNLQDNSVIKMTKFTTTETKNLLNEGTIDISGGSFTAELEAKSLTTFVTTDNVSSDGFNYQNGFDIQIFPNPSESGNFSLTINKPETKIPIKMQLFDISGRVVYQQSVVNRENEIKADLKSGIYFLNMTDGNSILSKKFIVK